MTKHEQILNLLPLELDSVITVMLETGIINIYSILKYEDEKTIWLETYGGNWYELEEADTNYDMVADAILNRLNEHVQS